MEFVCFNGANVPAGDAILQAQNRSFKYGDGVFETIKVYRDRVLLADLHFERLFLSLQLLKISAAFDAELLQHAILNLCTKNKCAHSARVRLSVYREENNSAAFLIEAISLRVEENKWHDRGLTIDVYPYARKAVDAFANLKTANFLPYVLAGLHAKEKGVDDCVVSNSDNHFCDTSKANLFLIKKGDLFTPALHQGCINGVIRRFLIDELKKKGFKIYQKEITLEDLENADEVFLTNAIIGMRWVQFFREKEYTCQLSQSIYGNILSTIYR